MKVAVIGTGRVGSAIAPVIAAAGHEVIYGVRDPADPRHGGDGIAVKTMAEAGAWADAILLAIGFGAIDAVLSALGPITGKILIDPINPYDFANALAPLLPPDQSAASVLQSKTDARVVKALNQVGTPVMSNANTRKVRPLQFVAGDDAAARVAVIALLADCGFDARDAGGLDYARELEGMARLWIAQAFAHGMPMQSSWVLSVE